MNIVITISRELGSRGSYIATAVAKTLGLRYIDREILDRAAELSGYPDAEMIQQLEEQERVPGVLAKVVNALNTLPLIPSIPSATLREGYFYDEQMAALMVQDGLTRDQAFVRVLETARRMEASATYAKLVHQVIGEYAEKGNVIIVGRGAQIVLRDFPGALHVRLHAPLEVRILHLMERLGLERKEAERQIHQSDKERQRYLKHFYNAAWDDPVLYHLTINTGKIAADWATQVICDLAKHVGLSLLG